MSLDKGTKEEISRYTRLHSHRMAPWGIVIRKMAGDLEVKGCIQGAGWEPDFVDPQLYIITALDSKIGFELRQ